MSRPLRGDQPRSQHVTTGYSSSAGSTTASISPSSSAYPADFTLSPKSSRKLSLQTYLATLPEWSSSTRLVSLYSEFDKLKETNPFGYEANINWWRTAILGAARNGLLSAYQPYPPTRNPAHGPSADQTQDRSEYIYDPTGSAIGILELDLDSLSTRFIKNGQRPHSLQAVMNEMARLEEVIPRSEFLPWAGVGWTGWIFHKVVKAPLLWSLKQLSLSDTSPSPAYSSSPTLISTGFSNANAPLNNNGLGANGVGGSAGAGGMLTGSPSLGSSSASPHQRDTYIVLPFVKEAASRILKLQQESISYPASDNLMTFADFRQKFSRTAMLPIRGKFSSEEQGSGLVLTDRDLEILIRYMHHELRVLVTGGLDPKKQSSGLEDHELVIKFATKEVVWEKTRQEITDTDRGIVELRETCKRLERQVQEIEDRMAELTDKARGCLRKNQKLQATIALRQKKILEEVLKKRAASSETLSSILFKIKSSETDAELLQSYKLGANTLASVMATRNVDGEQLLTRDKVESTMDHLADVFADQQEVDQALNDGADILMESTVNAHIDEDELMAELDALTEKHSEEPSRTKPARSSQQQSPELGTVVKPNATTAPGKRVAEIPEQTFVKQRKVSQSTVHSQREAKEGSRSRENSPQSVQESGSESRATTEVESHPTTTATPMDTDGEGLPVEEIMASTGVSKVPESIAALPLPPSPPLATPGPPTAPARQGTFLSSQEERDLEAMLTELEDIQVPERAEEEEEEPEDVVMDKVGQETLKSSRETKKMAEYAS